MNTRAIRTPRVAAAVAIAALLTATVAARRTRRQRRRGQRSRKAGQTAGRSSRAKQARSGAAAKVSLEADVALRVRRQRAGEWDGVADDAALGLDHGQPDHGEPGQEVAGALPGPQRRPAPWQPRHHDRSVTARRSPRRTRTSPHPRRHPRAACGQRRAVYTVRSARQCRPRLPSGRQLPRRVQGARCPDQPAVGTAPGAVDATTRRRTATRRRCRSPTWASSTPWSGTATVLAGPLATTHMSCKGRRRLEDPPVASTRGRCPTRTAPSTSGRSSKVGKRVQLLHRRQAAGRQGRLRRRKVRPHRHPPAATQRDAGLAVLPHHERRGLQGRRQRHGSPQPDGRAALPEAAAQGRLGARLHRR